MSESLANQFRPKTLAEVAGQPDAVSIIEAWQQDGSIPQIVLLVGPSGCGKTTIANLLTEMVGGEHDQVMEINSADDRSIDMARDLIEQMQYKPLPPMKSKIAIIDEVVQLPEATQQAMLDLLENPPKWSYLFLCTSKMTKLLPTFRSRCKVLKLQALEPGTIRRRLIEIGQKLPGTTYSSAIEKIAEKAQGNMREALSMLETIYLLPNAQQQLRALESLAAEDREDDPTGQLCRALLKGAGTMEALATVTDSPEGVRMRVLAYMNKVLRGSNPGRAGLVIDIFQYDFSQFGNQPQAGLAFYCWKAIARTGR